MHPFTTTDTPLARYADLLARVADGPLINRMAAAGLSRAERRRLTKKAKAGTLVRTDFPVWLVALFFTQGNGAFE